MREIKFRAWIPQHKKMFQVGNLVIPKGLNELGDQELCVAETYSITKPHHYIQPVLMQYTGLKDKNGKEIYEGDIVQDKVNNCIWLYVIQSISFMGNNLFAICIWRNFTVIDGETIMGDYSVKDGNWNYLSSTLEVIGNIYENPELLATHKERR